MNEPVRTVGVVGALLRAALVGVTAGIIARILMRAAALLTRSDLGFDPGVSAAIVGLFVIASVGACAGALLFRRSRVLGVIVTVAALVPLWLPGTSIAVVEVTEHAHGSVGVTLGVVAVALAIGACMVGAPVWGNRLGHIPQSRE